MSCRIACRALPATKYRSSGRSINIAAMPAPSRPTRSTSPSVGVHLAPTPVVIQSTCAGMMPAGAARPAAREPTNRNWPITSSTAVHI